jgi:hypothetical protein
MNKKGTIEPSGNVQLAEESKTKHLQACDASSALGPP